MPTLDAPSPVRNDVKRRLRKAISYRYGPGDRLPSTREISRMLSVAHGTAYRALCELHKEGVIVLRPRRGAFVSTGDKAGAAKQGVNALSHIHVAPYITMANQFTAEMYDGFRERAQGTGLNINPVMLPAPTGEGAPKPKPLNLASTDATIHFNPTPFSPLISPPDQAMVIVTAGVDIPQVKTARLDVVSVDQELGGRLAGQALREAGCEDAFFVGVREVDGQGVRGYRMTCAARLMGFEQGWGRRLPEDRLSFQTGYGVPPGMEAYEEFARRKMRRGGVFCATDELAGGFALRAAVRGLTVGRDFKLIGFDGQARISSLLGYSLPTIIVPTRELGLRAADMLIERLADPDQPQRRLLLGCTFRPTSQFHASAGASDHPSA